MGLPKSHQLMSCPGVIARFSLSLGERAGVRASVLIPLNMA